MCFSRTKAAIFGVGVMLSCAAAALGQQIQFTQRHAPGDQFEFSQQMSMESNIAVSMNGQVMQQMQQTIRQTRKGKMSVEQSDNAGKPTKATLAYDPSCGGDISMSGQPTQPTPTPLAGKSIIVTRTGEKELNFGGQADGLDQAAIEEVKEMFSQDQSMLPKHPMNVGDSWQLSQEELAQLIPPDSGMNAQGSGKLVGVENVGGRQVAVIEVNIEMTGNQAGMTMNCKLSGRGKMDVVSSRPVDMAISGPLTAQGNENGMEIKMDGKMSIAIKGNIAGGSGPAPRIEDVTNDIRNDGNNGAAGFAGTFTDNNKVTVELQQSGNGWTGSLRNGDKTFPIESASVNGNQISGKFNANGKSFDFSGTLNGNALTFKTGNSSYNLQRQADSVSDNPFN